MTLALSLFVLFYILMLAVQQYRPWVALGGAGAFLLLGKLGVYDFTLADAARAVDFNVLLMMAGMMGTGFLFIQSKMPARLAEELIAHVPDVRWAVSVLALLAEHLGEIPEASAYRVSKNTGAQNQMMDMPLGTLDKLQREVAEGKGEEILRTNMVWKGQEVWQKENLRVLAFDAALTEIGFGEGGMVFILPEANLIDETLERLLEQTPLV